MCNLDRIFEIEQALEVLGLEKCSFCSTWCKERNFREVISEDKVHRRLCVSCRKSRFKGRRKW